MLIVMAIMLIPALTVGIMSAVMPARL